MSEQSTKNITKSDSNFAQTFVDHYLLPNMDFNRHCLIKNISTLKNVIYLFLTHYVVN